jgi:hypothetical protein
MASNRLANALFEELLLDFIELLIIKSHKSADSVHFDPFAINDRRITEVDSKICCPPTE